MIYLLIWTESRRVPQWRVRFHVAAFSVTFFESDGVEQRYCLGKRSKTLDCLRAGVPKYFERCFYDRVGKPGSIALEQFNIVDHLFVLDASIFVVGAFPEQVVQIIPQLTCAVRVFVEDNLIHNMLHLSVLRIHDSTNAIKPSMKDSSGRQMHGKS